MKTLEIITNILNNKETESIIYTHDKKMFIKKITDVLNSLEIPFVILKKEGKIIMIDKHIKIVEKDDMKRNENSWVWKWLD